MPPPARRGGLIERHQVMRAPARGSIARARMAHACVNTIGKELNQMPKNAAWPAAYNSIGALVDVVARAYESFLRHYYSRHSVGRYLQPGPRAPIAPAPRSSSPVPRERDKNRDLGPLPTHARRFPAALPSVLDRPSSFDFENRRHAHEHHGASQFCSVPKPGSAAWHHQYHKGHLDSHCRWSSSRVRGQVEDAGRCRCHDDDSRGQHAWYCRGSNDSNWLASNRHHAH